MYGHHASTSNTRRDAKRCQDAVDTAAGLTALVPRLAAIEGKLGDLSGKVAFYLGTLAEVERLSPGIVDKALAALQASASSEAAAPTSPEPAPKRGPGRPRKTA